MSFGILNENLKNHGLGQLFGVYIKIQTNIHQYVIVQSKSSETHLKLRIWTISKFKEDRKKMRRGLYLNLVLVRTNKTSPNQIS